MYVNVLILDYSSKPLHEDIVEASALSIHTDLNSFRLEHIGKSVTCMLAALVTIKDFWLASAQSILQSFKVESCFQSTGELAQQDIEAIPI